MRHPKGEARPDQPAILVFGLADAGPDVDLEERAQQNRSSRLEAVAIRPIGAEGKVTVELTEEAENSTDRSTQSHRVVQVDICV